MVVCVRRRRLVLVRWKRMMMKRCTTKTPCPTTTPYWEGRSQGTASSGGPPPSSTRRRRRRMVRRTHTHTLTHTHSHTHTHTHTHTLTHSPQGIDPLSSQSASVLCKGQLEGNGHCLLDSFHSVIAAIYLLVIGICLARH